MRKVEARKLTIPQKCGGIICTRGILRIIEHPKMLRLTVPKADFRKPLAPISINAAKRVSSRATVRHFQRESAETQVCASIVEPVAINVVNSLARKCANNLPMQKKPLMIPAIGMGGRTNLYPPIDVPSVHAQIDGPIELGKFIVISGIDQSSHTVRQDNFPRLRGDALALLAGEPHHGHTR